MWIILWKTCIQQWETKTYDIDQIDPKCPIPSPENHEAREEDFNSNKRNENNYRNKNNKHTRNNNDHRHPGRGRR